MVAAPLGAISLTLMRANRLPLVVFALLMPVVDAISVLWLGSRFLRATTRSSAWSCSGAR